MKIKTNVLKYKDPDTGTYAPIPIVVSGDNEEIMKDITELNEKLVQEMGKISEEIDDVFVKEKSTNLWNPEESEIGRLQNDGTVDNNATSYVSSGYINIAGNIGKYICPQKTNNNILYGSLCFYDEHKNKIPTQLGGGGLGTGTTAKLIELENAFYVRASIPATLETLLFIGLSDTNQAFSNIDVYKNEKYVKREYLRVIDNIYWYKDKKIVFYGDSVTARGNFEDHIKSYFNFSEWVNCGIGGSTVANVNTDLEYDTTENAPMVTDIRINTIPTDADVIVFFGGINDWGAKVELGTIKDGEKTFKGAYMLTIKKLQARCPNALIICATPINGRLNTSGVAQDYPMELSNGKMLKEYRDAIMEVSSLYALPCIDIFGECRINTLNAPLYLSDTIHQNNEGAKMLAVAFINGLIRFEPKEI